jgi:DNA adenine methylase
MEFNVGLGSGSFNKNIKYNFINFKNKLDSIDAIFSSLNFKDIDIDNINDSDFIYCDPPYILSLAPYNIYWNLKSETDLYNWLDKLNDKGVRFALSNVIKHKSLTNDILLEWSQKYKTTYLYKHYANCNYQVKNRNKNETSEVLITNYIPEVKQEKTLFDEIFNI